jgi:pimeloyl-ACP methyl ester carboxylesterase
MSKSPILFVHGMWSTPGAFKHIQKVLEAAGYSVEAADYRNAAVAKAGGLAKVGLADYVSVLEGIAMALPEKPILVGHSMGGLIAQLLAVRVQPKALVLLSTAPSNGSALIPQYSALKAVWSVTSAWNFWKQESNLSRADAMYGVYNNVPAAEAEAEFAAHVADSGRALAQIAFAAFDGAKAATVDYAQLTCPSLVMVGTEDRITPSAISRATARRLAGPVTYKELDGFGHWIVGAQASPIVAQQIKDFLAVPGGASA